MLKFNAQCAEGHVFIAPQESDLERRCALRAKDRQAVTETVRAEDCVFCQMEDPTPIIRLLLAAQGD